MKKVFFVEALAVLLLAGVMLLLLYRKTPADVPLSDVNSALSVKYSLSGMEPAGDMRMKRTFSLNASDYREYIYYAPDNTMSVNEILIVKRRIGDAPVGHQIQHGAGKPRAVVRHMHMAVRKPFHTHSLL